MITQRLSAHHPARAGAPSGRSLPRALFIIQLVMGVISVPCGALLIINGMGMPTSVLDDAPFETFTIPGILLAVVVGGSLLLAAWLIRVHDRWAPIASIGAGAILLGWIAVQVVMVHAGRPLQAFVFVTSLVIIGLAWRFHRDQDAWKEGVA